MKNLFSLLLLAFFSQTLFGQQYARGPIEPSGKDYLHYKSYSIKLNLSKGLEESLKKYNIAYSSESFEKILGINGLSRKFNDADFKVNYNLVRYALVTEIKYEKSPAFHIGLESNLEIFDKENKLIYKRYTKPFSRLYITDATAEYGKVVNKLIAGNFNEMIADFDQFYLYTPVLENFRNLEVEKKKKSDSKFNVEEFNASREVFSAMMDVDRKDWGKLFEEAQKYWLPLTKYEDKDSKMVDRVRTAASYNLALSYILLDKIEEARQLLPIIQEHETKTLGMRDYSPDIKKHIEAVETAKRNQERNESILAIQQAPTYPDYLKSDAGFSFAEFNGEVIKEDGTSIKGIIRIINGSPEIKDMRSGDNDTRSNGARLVGGLLSTVGAYNSDVEVTVAGKKKPERTTLKKVSKIIDGRGNTYFVGKIGRNLNVAKESETNNRRYALMSEVKKGNGTTLYEEFFPQNDLVFKKDNQEDFYMPPLLVNRKKSLKEFFNCNELNTLIDRGVYQTDSKEIYILLFEDFLSKCKK